MSNLCGSIPTERCRSSSSKLLIALRNGINELSHKVKTPPAAGLNMGWLKWLGGSKMTSKASMCEAGGLGRLEVGLSFADDGKVIGSEFLSSFGEVVRG